MELSEEKYLLSLESLVDISILLNSGLEYSSVLQSAILTCLGQVTCKFGIIYVKKPLEDNLSLSYQKGIDSEKAKSDSIQFIDVDSEFMKFIHEQKNPLLYEKGMDSVLDEINPKLIIPLFARERLVGIMGIGEKYFGEYSDEDMQFLAKFSMITANAIENSLLYSLATKDTKTGLFLHHYFMNRLGEEVYKCERYEGQTSVVMIDIDHFKKVNDTYGHQAGDYVLEKLGKIILDFIREADLPSRFGGEEFSVILPSTDEAGAYHFSDRLREEIENKEFVFNGAIIPVTASLGVSEYQKGVQAKELIENADKALYLAKESGRNQVKTYSDYLREKE